MESTLKRHKNIIIFSSDLILIVFSYIFAFILLHEFRVPLFDRGTFSLHVGVITLIYSTVFYLFHLYGSLWSIAGYYDYLNIVIANGISVLFVLLYNGMLVNHDLSYSLIIIAAMMILLGSISSRMFFRVYRRSKRQKHALVDPEVTSAVRRVLIVGAGQAAAMIIKEIRNHRELLMDVVGLVDDAQYKQSSHISGYRVLGTTQDMPRIVEEERIDEILLAIPSLSHEERRKILDVAKTTSAKLKTLPGIYEMVDKGINIKSIRDVEISDLLGRKEVHLNNEKIEAYIQDKVVLVTGGGGSIGSELCRQITKLQPKKLIILDIYENNAYDIELELRRNHPELNLVTLIASVRDQKKMERVFQEYRPEIVFHAAAHKHVPLMETSPEEAVKNNVFGTLHVATAAKKYQSERFILISTDKAVNPTNIMGASKRLCEMIVQTLDTQTKDTDFVAVRFGNVLGSNGSVIPLFKEQIKNGGPVTLTHEEITRFFMTIPEAVQLVLQAGSYAQGGEIFVLDMGEPVKIYDLAENLIRLSGYEPHKEIEIKVTGLRPGEKLYEELLMAEEGLESTPNELIFVGRPNGFDKDTLGKTLRELEENLYDEHMTAVKVKEIIRDIVGTYTPDFHQ